MGASGSYERNGLVHRIGWPGDQSACLRKFGGPAREGMEPCAVDERPVRGVFDAGSEGVFFVNEAASVAAADGARRLVGYGAP